MRLSDRGIRTSGYYARSDTFNPPYHRAFAHASRDLWSRRGVAERLTRANAFLKEYGVELLVLDAYRSLALQQELWSFFLELGRSRLEHATGNQIREFASRYCSDPTQVDPLDPFSFPVHATGGAVDVTLAILGTPEILFMGGIFDDASPVSHTAYCEDAEDDGEQPASLSRDEARRNRRLLYWAMHAAGFTNYCYEWWHFDFGTHLWMNEISVLPGQGGVEPDWLYALQPSLATPPDLPPAQG